jgi:hypothetical protein
MPDTNWYLTMHVDGDHATDTRVRSALEHIGTLLRGEDATEWNRTLGNYKGNGRLDLRLPARVLSENPAIIPALQNVSSTFKGSARDEWLGQMTEQFSSHGMASMLTQAAQSGGARNTTTTAADRSAPGGTSTR